MRRDIVRHSSGQLFKQLTVVAFCGLVWGCSSSTTQLSADAGVPSKALGNKGNIASLTQVINKNPQDANALNLRGTAFAQVKKFKEALRDFNAAISLNPNYYQAYNNRALVFYKLGKFNRAMNDYNEAIRLAPNYHHAYIGRGKLHRKMKRTSLALADFSHAIDIYGEYPVAYYFRGLIYQSLNQHENAVQDFTSAINLRPGKSGGPYYARGISRLAISKFEDAYEDFYIAARSRKGHYKAWAYRGLAAEKDNKPQKAARAYRRALGINPSYKPAVEGLRRVGDARDGAGPRA